MRRTPTNEATGWVAVAQHYGLYAQLNKLIEEVSEYMQADALFGAGALTEDALVSEIADVFAVSQQVDYLLGDATGELEDLISRASRSVLPAQSVNPVVLYGSAVIYTLSRACSRYYRVDRSEVLVPLSNLLAYMRWYCAQAHCERAVRRTMAAKLSRQQRRMKEEDA